MILKRRVLRLVAWLRRYPWIVALFGFFSGVASFILVDRQEGIARVIPLVLLASWLWLLLENVLRRWLDARFHMRLPQPVVRYITQLIHQESFFFVLPFFFFATVWNSGQAVFMAALCLAALISVVDPVYYKWLAPRRWVFLGYHMLALFTVLLTALPIILQVPTSETYRYALAAAVVLSLPSFMAILRRRVRWRGLALVGLLLALGIGGWYGRLWVPPATLRLTEVALSLELDRAGRSPGQSVSELTEAQLRGGGVYAYTAINAPLGLEEKVFHVWRYDGRVVDRIALEIRGGREAGYRAWSVKQNFPEDATGRWQVQVVTDAGQMVGSMRFRVRD